MISASKSTLRPNNLKILRPKVIKNLTNLRNKFCESTPTGGTQGRDSQNFAYFGGRWQNRMRVNRTS